MDKLPVELEERQLTDEEFINGVYRIANYNRDRVFKYVKSTAETCIPEIKKGVEKVLGVDFSVFEREMLRRGIRPVGSSRYSGNHWAVFTREVTFEEIDRIEISVNGLSVSDTIHELSKHLGRHAVTVDSSKAYHGGSYYLVVSKKVVERTNAWKDRFETLLEEGEKLCENMAVKWEESKRERQSWLEHLYNKNAPKELGTISPEVRKVIKGVSGLSSREKEEFVNYLLQRWGE